MCDRRDWIDGCYVVHAQRIFGRQFDDGCWIANACRLGGFGCSRSVVRGHACHVHLAIGGCVHLHHLGTGTIGTWIWFSLVARIGAVRAATFHFLNPFFGVAVAAVVLGESLGMSDAIGVIIITVGILAVQLSKQNPTGR